MLYKPHFFLSSLGKRPPHITPTTRILLLRVYQPYKQDQIKIFQTQPKHNNTHLQFPFIITSSKRDMYTYMHTYIHTYIHWVMAATQRFWKLKYSYCKCIYTVPRVSTCMWIGGSMCLYASAWVYTCVCLYICRYLYAGYVCLPTIDSVDIILVNCGYEIFWKTL